MPLSTPLVAVVWAKSPAATKCTTPDSPAPCAVDAPTNASSRSTVASSAIVRTRMTASSAATAADGAPDGRTPKCPVVLAREGSAQVTPRKGMRRRGDGGSTVGSVLVGLTELLV